MKSRVAILILLIAGLTVVLYLKQSINPDNVGRLIGVSVEPANGSKVNEYRNATNKTNVDLEGRTDLIKKCPPYDFSKIQKNAREEINTEKKFIGLLKTEPSEYSEFVMLLHFESERVLNLGDSLREFIKKYPHNRLARWSLLVYCHEAKEKACSIDEVESIVNEDSENAAAWLNLASFQLTNGYKNQAIESLKKASTSQLFNEYRKEYFETLQLGLPAYLTPLEKNFTILGMFHTTYSSSYGKIIDLCKNNKGIDAQLFQLCTNTGMRVEEDGELTITKSYGKVLHAISYTGVDDKIYEDFKKANRARHKITKVNPALDLIMYDDQLFDLYIESYKNHGEERAISILNAEAIRLSSNPNYNPCPES